MKSGPIWALLTILLGYKFLLVQRINSRPHAEGVRGHPLTLRRPSREGVSRGRVRKQRRDRPECVLKFPTCLNRRPRKAGSWGRPAMRGAERSQVEKKYDTS